MYPAPRENKSEKMRQLFDSGMQIADIARVLGVRYQYVYNVISFHIKQKEGSWTPNVTGDSSDRGVYVSVVAVG